MARTLPSFDQTLHYSFLRPTCYWKRWTWKRLDPCPRDHFKRDEIVGLLAKRRLRDKLLNAWPSIIFNPKEVWMSAYLIPLTLIFRTYGSGTRKPHYPPIPPGQRPGVTARSRDTIELGSNDLAFSYAPRAA